MTLTAGRLRELLRYDPETGMFIHLVTRCGRAVAGNSAGHASRRKNGHSYLMIKIDDRTYAAHRLAFLWMTGSWPTDRVDHVDRNGLNNRWENLRIATRSQNGANAVYRKNSTGLKGVTCRKHGRYQAQIQVAKRRIYLGMYGTPEEAHTAYAVAAERYFGDFARTEHVK